MSQYNNKQFLAPNSINSMSVVHCKAYQDGKAVVRISDCHNSIRLWNNIDSPAERQEMIQKLSTLEHEITKFKAFLSTYKSLSV